MTTISSLSTVAPDVSEVRLDGGRRPSVAIVHDYLTQRGGAERVTLALLKAFPEARVVTTLYQPDKTFPEFKNYKIETSFLNRFKVFSDDPRLALPLLPWAVDSLRIKDVDVILTSSSGFAHGVKAEAPKLVYCHNPPRWLYQYEDYALNLPSVARLALRVLRPMLLSWDRRAALSATRYLANSRAVKDRIAQAYGLRADVLPPPVMIDPDGSEEPVAGLEPGYFLCVSRSRGYKNVRMVCEAIESFPDQRLVVVGGLPDRAEPWPDRLTGLVDISDSQLRWLYKNARALLATAHEDFGLTPLEANAFGTPALALRAGGYLETVVEGVNGYFLEGASSQAVVAAIRHLFANPLSSEAIKKYAATYNLDAFCGALRHQVQTLLASASKAPETAKARAK